MNFYSSLIKFLGRALGENDETPFYTIQKRATFILLPSKTIDISGQDIDSSVTGFTLNLIRSKRHLTQGYLGKHNSQAINEKNLKGATLLFEMIKMN
ncbi:TPA: PAS domain-containing protein [Enterococcus faecium]|uniref:PAS domain-containing protein n=1 Tax=Enterococcus TaxID=1350 RepID=UPI00032DE012|nr:MULTISPECIES: PAS domain-containing protein [Enterococcus]EOH38211.1 hypothetical protein SQW_01337 [Enterococcus faecium EnGen0185]EOH46538.1 hypothetical protein SSG_01339 [Enterococcus faecium EnGen0190]MCL4590972.1 PAS domain-containing protein [Enterococcus hirae]MCU7775629.1 PAS domain-containing protein [Enterococcus faecium]MCV3179325.1 PAS domain-containing protein [Enterococcus faecium]